MGSWTGGSYTGLTGLVDSGRNGGGWDGSGIVTSSAAPNKNVTTLGVARFGVRVNLRSTTEYTETRKAWFCVCVFSVYSVVPLRIRRVSGAAIVENFWPRARRKP